MKTYFSAIVLVMMTLTSFSQTNKETKIGSQIWMVQNLKVDKFQNGDAIPHAKTGKRLFVLINLHGVVTTTIQRMKQNMVNSIIGMQLKIQEG
jgi:hypothetical protein